MCHYSICSILNYVKIDSCITKSLKKTSNSSSIHHYKFLCVTSDYFADKFRTQISRSMLRLLLFFLIWNKTKLDFNNNNLYEHKWISFFFFFINRDYSVRVNINKIHWNNYSLLIYYFTNVKMKENLSVNDIKKWFIQELINYFHTITQPLWYCMRMRINTH